MVFPVLLELGSSSLNPSFYLSAGDRRRWGGVERVEKARVQLAEGREASLRDQWESEARCFPPRTPTKPPLSKRECVGCALAVCGPDFSCTAQFTGLLTLIL